MSQSIDIKVKEIEAFNYLYSFCRLYRNQVEQLINFSDLIQLYIDVNDDTAETTQLSNFKTDFNTINFNSDSEIRTLSNDHVIFKINREVILTVKNKNEIFTKKNIREPNNADYDAFGRLRISSPKTIFDSRLLRNDDRPLIWDEQLESGSGITASTPTIAKPYIDFTSTISTAGLFTRQTKRYFNYQTGKSQLILITGVLNLSGGGTGCMRRIGYFDDNDGLFFNDNAGTYGVTIRSNDSGSPVDTTIVQANWNVDIMDGTGSSGITIDFTKSQIFVIDFQWLSVGRVRFGLEINGMLYYIHQQSQVNNYTIPYMSNPNLPIRYQIITTSASPVSTMRCICSAVISEGGEDMPSYTNSTSTSNKINANTTGNVYALCGIRLKTMSLNATIDVFNLSIIATTTDDFEWILCFNPTVTGGLTYSDISNSAVQHAEGDIVGSNSTTTLSDVGIIISRGYGTQNLSPNVKIQSALKLGSTINGIRDELVLAVIPLSSNLDVRGSMTWREII